MPATIDTRKKISAHFRIVIAHSCSLCAADRRPHRNRWPNCDRWNWFHRGSGLLRVAAWNDFNQWPTIPGKPGWAGSLSGRPLGNVPMPSVPPADVLGTPGRLTPVVRFAREPAPMPVEVVDETPGAEAMPAEPGFCGATVPVPGEAPIATPAPC